MTPSQFKALGRADKNGLLIYIGTNGLARAGWTRMMERLVASGHVKRYVHGDYEITDLGRAVAVSQASCK